MSHDLPKLSPRAPETHKGDVGRVLLVGGSRGMTGSISLAGLAALRSGAGLVTIATAESCLGTVAGFDPNYMTVPMPEDDGGRLSGEVTESFGVLLQVSDVIAIGPGLGQSAGLSQRVRDWYQTLAKPLVIDADGLNALAGGLPQHPPAPRILTPHPGEFRRLFPESSRLQNDRQALEDVAVGWAKTNGVVLVLKGHRSLITDGRQVHYNTTGNPGMATGGCGDVLTGIIAGLLGQGLNPLQAARAGCYVHGLAGDHAASRHGQVSLVASDLIHHLPLAVQDWLEPED